MTERRDDEQTRRDEEADAALASAGAAAGPAAGEEAEAPEEVVETPEEVVEVPDLPGGAPAGGEESATGEEPVEADLQELREQAAKAGEFLALAQRTQADFENFRKRAQRDVAAAEARGIARLARELMPAMDNLERALAAAEAAEQEHHLTEGIRLVQAELSAALGRIGIEGFTPKGEQFDPNVHEAMAQTPVEGAASGTIVEVYQQGYRLADQVLRPARVVVAA